MMHRNRTKKTYRTPLSWSAKLEVENALLVGSVRLQVEVDELDNVNKRGGDDPSGEMYFEF